MTTPPIIFDRHLDQLVAIALSEDIGAGDITSNSLFSASHLGRARFLAKQDLTLCGTEAVEAVFAQLDSAVKVQWEVQDGDMVKMGDHFGTISGPLRSLLTGERTALNFLQRLSGITSHVSRLAALIASTGVELLDTRKTTPGWRVLEKYAVKIGGGVNHRMGLYDRAMVKNNHRDFLGGSTKELVDRIRAFAAARNFESVEICVEVRNIPELRSALISSAERILLDNMTPVEVKEAVRIVREDRTRARYIEASGGITEASLVDYANTGVDGLSLGSLTYGAQPVDIAFRVQSLEEAELSQ